jgi:hypothetical protein
MKKLLHVIFFLYSFGYAFAQVNGYAKVTGVSGKVLTLTNVNQTYGTFKAGDDVIVIQMQGASISGNTSNNSSFGILSNLNSAGLYEVVKVASVNGSATSLTLATSLTNTYSTAGSLQVVTFPQLGVTNYTTTAHLVGLPWDGNTGGIVAFNVKGKLYLRHNIIANSIGFRGGKVSGSEGGPCENSTWRASSNTKYADKGEGVYITSSGQKAGKAKAVNGGGGGILHNGGGGGGSNFTGGGVGAYGYPGDGCSNGSMNAGGQGGIPITSSPSQVFLGGGGGGGQENNNVGTDGGTGGGIILVTADSILVSGSCSSALISANGESAQNSGRDGAGGGGAGGTIVLNVKGFNVKSSCPLTISANGGDGGNVIHVDVHGAGGGGGQGAIYISSLGTFSNTVVTTEFGLGGAVNTNAVSYAGNGGGPVNGGVFTGPFSRPFPVGLPDFNGIEAEPGVVYLSWRTQTEKNNQMFGVFHSSDGTNWTQIGNKEGAGTTQRAIDYEFTHFRAQTGVNYYKLKQTDYDGQYKFSPIIYVDIQDVKIKVRTFPNPTTDLLNIESDEDLSAEKILMMDAFGASVEVDLIRKSKNQYAIDLSHLPKGMYFLYSQKLSEKVIIR